MWEQPRTKFLKLSGNGLQGREGGYGKHWVGINWRVAGVVMKNAGWEWIGGQRGWLQKTLGKQ